MTLDSEGPQRASPRKAADRRRYNRRSGEELSPPYFEVFERIAVALEGIRDQLPEREVVLPHSDDDLGARETGSRRGVSSSAGAEAARPANAPRP